MRSSRPPTFTTPIPTRSTRSPAPPTASELIAECFGDRRPGSPTSARVHAGQAGRRGRRAPTRACGWWCWPSTAWSCGVTPREEAYERTVAVVQPGRRARQRRSRGCRDSAARPPTAALDADARARAAAGGAAGAARRGLERAPEGPDRRRLAGGARAGRLRARAASVTTVGAACPDHLVHTKRVPLWVPYDPATRRRRRRCASAHRRGAAAYREEYAAYVERTPPRSTPIRPTPIPRVVLIQNLGLVGGRNHAEGRAALARPVPPRDRGDGRRRRARRVRLARRGRELRRRVLAARAVQARRWRRRPASSRAGSRSSPAPPAASAARSCDALAARARAWSPSTSTATAPSTRSRPR